MNGKLIRRLPVLAGCALVASMGLVKAYHSRRAADAIAVALIWLLITPLLALWWLESPPRSLGPTSTGRLITVVASALLVGAVTLLWAYLSRSYTEALAAVLIWLVIIPLWAKHSLRRSRQRQ
jgi:hypothetical protein